MGCAHFAQKDAGSRPRRTRAHNREGLSTTFALRRGRRLTTQHIGAAGELLVQCRLLKLGVDSARLTTDAGIDLVVYSPGDGRATTVQVKTVRKPMPSGGRGRLAVGWTFPHELRAELLAVALLPDDAVWLFTLDEARTLAQQHAETGGSTDTPTPTCPQRAGSPLKQTDLGECLLERRAPTLFP